MAIKKLNYKKMKNISIREIIEKSFLGKEQKKQLFDELESEGETQKFFEHFDKFLVGAIEQKERKLDEVIREFKVVNSGLEKEKEEKIKALEQKTEKILAGLKIDDMDKKEKIWDGYYKEIERIYEKYEEQIKSIITKLKMSLI